MIVDEGVICRGELAVNNVDRAAVGLRRARGGETRARATPQPMGKRTAESLEKVSP